MLSILLVSPEVEPIGPGAPLPADLEVLLARDAEEAVEKLGRNRRIDAIVLAAGPANFQIAAAILEDNPAAPPLFAVEPAVPAGARVLPQLALSELLDRVLEALEGTANS